MRHLLPQGRLMIGFMRRYVRTPTLRLLFASVTEHFGTGIHEPSAHITNQQGGF